MIEIAIIAGGVLALAVMGGIGTLWRWWNSPAARIDRRMARYRARSWKDVGR